MLPYFLELPVLLLPELLLLLSELELELDEGRLDEPLLVELPDFTSVLELLDERDEDDEREEEEEEEEDDDRDEDDDGREDDEDEDEDEDDDEDDGRVVVSLPVLLLLLLLLLPLGREFDDGLVAEGRVVVPLLSLLDGRVDGAVEVDDDPVDGLELDPGRTVLLLLLLLLGRLLLSKLGRVLTPKSDLRLL